MLQSAPADGEPKVRENGEPKVRENGEPKVREGEPKAEDRAVGPVVPANERAFFDASPFATLLFTPDLVMLDCNCAHSTMTGKAPEVLRGRGIFEVFPPAPDARGPSTEDVIRASVARAVKTGAPDEPPVQEHALERGDGTFESHFWRMIHSPVVEGGVVVAIRQDSWDVTGTVQGERRQDSLRRMASSISAVAFWEHDPQTGMTVRSRELDVIFGFPPPPSENEALMKPVDLAPYMARVLPEDVPRLDAAMAEMMAGPLHEPRRMEYRLRRPDGEVRKVVVRGETTMGADGQIVVIGTTLDVTDIHANEERLKALLADKELLLGEVNHRVKNSLQLVDSLLSMEARRLSGQEGRVRFLAAVNRVRAVAAAHASLYHDEDVRRLEFASHLRHFCQHLAEGLGQATRGIELDIRTEPVTLPAETAVPLSLIVNELVTNALQHAFGDRDTPSRGGRVSVTFARSARGYRLAVSDNGTAYDGSDGTESAATASSVSASVARSGDLLADPADASPTPTRPAPSRPNTGTGLRLVETLARQIDATVTRSHDDGWHTSIEFPA